MMKIKIIKYLKRKSLLLKIRFPTKGEKRISQSPYCSYISPILGDEKQHKPTSRQPSPMPALVLGKDRELFIGCSRFGFWALLLSYYCVPGSTPCSQGVRNVFLSYCMSLSFD